jgi:hypothetical protein
VNESPDLSIEEYEQLRQLKANWASWRADIDAMDKALPVSTCNRPHRGFARMSPTPRVLDKGNRAMPVMRSDGRMWGSLLEASKALGMPHSTIITALRNGHVCKGYRWYCVNGILEQGRKIQRRHEARKLATQQQERGAA